MANSLLLPNPSVTSATQIGAVGEMSVAAGLILASNGRLSPFKAMADDGGIDLLIYDKHTGIGVPLQVKTRTTTLARNPNTCHFQVRHATFNPHKHSHLIAILISLDGPNAHIRSAWLIPMSKLASIARRGKDNLVIRPSISTGSKDRCSGFRCTSLEGIALKIIDYCEAVVSSAT